MGNTNLQMIRKLCLHHIIIAAAALPAAPATAAAAIAAAAAVMRAGPLGGLQTLVEPGF